MSIQTVAVVGAGQMGAGIAQVCATSGLEVILNDLNAEALERGMASIRSNLERMLSKNKLTQQQRDAVLARITTHTDFKQLAQADIIIEAASENEAIKTSIFKQLAAICKPSAILATNTSSISITRLAAATARPEQVIGMHFMNPVPVLQLVEVIRALQTHDAVFDAVTDLAKQLDKIPVDVKDAPGFVANRILLPMINEAIFTLYEGLASASEIDTVMKLGMAHPLGPLALADLIGLDTCLSIMNVLHAGFNDSKYRPCPLLKQMVAVAIWDVKQAVDSSTINRGIGMDFKHIQLNMVEETKFELFQNILLDEVCSGIYRLTINRPQVLKNALNAETLREMDRALDILSGDPAARVLLITGGGDKAFVAGADIEHMLNLSPIEAKRFAEQGMRIFRRLETLNIPVIGLVNGYALGGGCELAMSCDFILAADTAKFGQPEVNLGATPGFGGSQRLTRLVGRAMAMELLVTGRIVTAQEALQRGLVNHIHPKAELWAKGLELATMIAAKSSSAISLTKQLVQRGQDLDLDNACVMESDLFGLSFSTPDRSEGMSAFLANRQPQF